MAGMMNFVDEQYLNCLRQIKEYGVYKETRSGEVLSLFGMSMRFDLKNGFPVLTTKKMFTKGRNCGIMLGEVICAFADGGLQERS